MRVVVQRVSRASVTVDGKITGEIGRGLLLLVAMQGTESDEDLDWMVNRCVGLRIFPDSEGKMNLSLEDAEGEILVVSQFTLYGDCRKGRRPSFIGAGDPQVSEKLIERFVGKIRAAGVNAGTGIFGADMKVELLNDGPVTLIIDKP
jgi:D-tyrosyl-tRNA(Tyr) deacylase